MKKKLLYIIDNINYLGGVPKATAIQANKLVNNFEITVFSLEKPKDEVRSLFLAANFIYLEDSFFKTLTITFSEAMKSKEISFNHKILRIAFSAFIRLGLSGIFIKIKLKKKLYNLFNGFDVVCVSGHDSNFRDIVASLSKPKKIQWIHTDYYIWSEYDNRTKALAKNDLSKYLRFDKIICISKSIKQGLIKKMPQLESRAVVIPNFIDFEHIIKSADMPIDIRVDRNLTNIITVTRLAPEKNIEGYLRLAKYLAEKGYSFKLYIVGDGELRESVKELIIKNRLQKYVVMTGYLQNPHPLVKQCDIFALLSHIEAIPLVIDEALSLGIPVIATDVGGISSQINKNVNGLLVKNDEEIIKSAFDSIFQNKHELSRLKTNAQINTEAATERNSAALKKVREVFL